jgi:glycine/D-amino acid oxidase-like deaminating enzyme
VSDGASRFFLRRARPFSHRSLWLLEALEDDRPLPELDGSARADVAIIGGGYVGLWTALALREEDPGCDVAVLEQDVCGGGASGRNGGFALSWWPKIATLLEICGEEDGIRIARASEHAVDDLGQFCERNAIDASFRRGGYLWTATTRAQIGAWDETLDLCQRLGVRPFKPVSSEELAQRTGSPVHLAGILEPVAATVHPARLVRGLRRVALERGVRIYERTKVDSFERCGAPLVRTARASLTADRLVVATNAWSAGIRELHRRVAVISSDIVATAPIPDRLGRIGWTGGECISDSQLQIDYYRTTDDGRIVFGKGGWAIALAGRVTATFDHDPRRAEIVAAEFRRVYPMLWDVPIEYDWAGPIDRTPKGIPIIGHLGDRPRIVYAVGWSGNGVAPSLLGGHVLAALALGREPPRGLGALVDVGGGAFPPDPIRFLGAHVVRAAVARKEQAEALHRKPSCVATALARLAPPGIIPKRTPAGRAPPMA